MKKNLYILLLFAILAIPAFLQAAQPVRRWNTISGQTTLAALDDPQDGDEPEMIYLVKNGKRYTVPLNSFSQEDQDYVNSVRSSARDLNAGLWDNPEETDDSEECIDPEENDYPTVDNARNIVPVSSQNQYVLLIGVNEYVKPIKSLNFCVNDMHLLAESFMKIGIPKENIILLTDDSCAERRPTGSNIRRQIKNITKRLGQNDQLTIAFSGHGVMIHGKSYLCPCDTNLDDINSIVSREWAFEQLEKCKAKQKIFIIDACRNKVSSDGQKSLDGARTIADPIGAKTHGFILMASCDKAQKSWEDASLQHGVFTYFLAKGLAGAACDNEGYVSILDLFVYASKATKTFVFDHQNVLQVPTIKQGGETTNFVLAKVEQPKKSHTGGKSKMEDIMKPSNPANPWIEFGLEIARKSTNGLIPPIDLGNNDDKGYDEGYDEGYDVEEDNVEEENVEEDNVEERGPFGRIINNIRRRRAI